ncbi:hypothetical protein QA601_03750 [Chitinispirillales bacterium ANBcel5]|uniref:hypothetical protein n=1 Tax=Cellulosispirillum alkaliphilum TaxID=3039283 RepID=UPI002A4E7E98|nr:hypothetical protein [Chitinispirillales bacterium ANBcel5]
MKTTSRSILLLIFLFIRVSADTEDFKNLKVYAGITHTTYNSEFANIWQENVPLLLQLETNYLYFDFTASFCYSYYTSEIENYQGVKVDMALSYPVRLTNFAHISFGIKAGNYLMIFDLENRHAAKESELYVGAELSLHTTLWRNFLAKVSYEHNRIYTKRRIDFSELALLFGYSFKTPQFLKEFLK